MIEDKFDKITIKAIQHSIANFEWLLDRLDCYKLDEMIDEEAEKIKKQIDQYKKMKKALENLLIKEKEIEKQMNLLQETRQLEE